MPRKKVGDDGHKSGSNTYSGKWIRREKGDPGYVGSRAKARMEREPEAMPVFNRMAVRNITDYFGWENVAATLGCTLTKVKELRLYALHHKDRNLLTKLHVLNAEYMRNLNAIDVPPIHTAIEFNRARYSWMTPAIIAIMRKHLKLGCFQGIQAYKNKSYLKPEVYIAITRADTNHLNEKRKKARLEMIKKRQK